jgi:hypothetical protein
MELLHIRITETAVDVEIRFIGKGGPHFFHIIVTEAGGKEQGGGMLHLPGSFCLDADGVCFGLVFLLFFVHWNGFRSRKPQVVALCFMLLY